MLQGWLRGYEVRKAFKGPRLGHIHDPEAPLHAFEHDIKFGVDCGLFFFTAVNAGVKFSNVGAMTVTVLASLIIGKTLGIVGFATAAMAAGHPLPIGISISDIWMIGFLASLGLTVALFVCGEAFEDLGLQGEAKMGALLSGLVGCVAVGLRRTGAFIPSGSEIRLSRVEHAAQALDKKAKWRRSSAAAISQMEFAQVGVDTTGDGTVDTVISPCKPNLSPQLTSVHVVGKKGKGNLLPILGRPTLPPLVDIVAPEIAVLPISPAVLAPPPPLPN